MKRGDWEALGGGLVAFGVLMALLWGLLLVVKGGFDKDEECRERGGRIDRAMNCVKVIELDSRHEGLYRRDMETRRNE